MPINYNLKKIGSYTLLALALFVVSLFIKTPYEVLNLSLKTVLILIYAVVVVKKDLPLKELRSDILVRHISKANKEKQ